MEAKTVIKRTLPILIGGLIGFAYYHFIGCTSGSCPITGNPYISTAYGAVIGLVFAMPSKRKTNKENSKL